MKKKLLVLLLALTAAVACAFGLAGCDYYSYTSYHGVTFYAYNSYYDKIDTKDSITLNNGTYRDGTWTDGDGFSGEYKVNNNKITLYLEMFGEKMELISGEFSDYRSVLKTTDTVYVSTDHRHSFGSWQDKQGVADTQVRQCICGKEETRVIQKENGVTYTDKRAISCDASVTEVTLRSDTIEIADSAFSGCSSLTSITIPDSVTSIGEMAFADCSGLESITVGANNLNFKSVNNCLLTKDGKTLILGCKNSVIPNVVTSIGFIAFFGCSGLTNITIPDSVTSIGEGAFFGCSGLTSITIPDSVTSIGNRAFDDCLRLIEVYNKSSLTITAGSEDNGCVARYAKNVYMQEGGSKLTVDSNGFVIFDGNTVVNYFGDKTEITIPDVITDINAGAFCSFSFLCITIHNSVTSIGSYVFAGCPELAIIFNGTVEQWKAISKDSEWDAYLGYYTIHCTDGDID